MADFNNRLGDYVDVAARIAEFRGKYPDGSLQPADLMQPYRIETIADRTFIVVVAAAYRTPTDERPGIGMAYEAWPGRTPYTKDSELMNAETSAWGRAIVAVLAADTKRGIASADEVRNRQAEREHAEPAWDPGEQEMLRSGWEAEIDRAENGEQIREIGRKLLDAKRNGSMSPSTYQHLAVYGGKRKGELDAAVLEEQPATVTPAADSSPEPDRRRRQLAAMDRAVEKRKETADATT